VLSKNWPHVEFYRYHIQLHPYKKERFSIIANTKLLYLTIVLFKLNPVKLFVRFCYHTAKSMFLHVQLLSRAKFHQKMSRAKESTVEDSCLILLNGKGFSGAREMRTEEVRS